MYPMINEGAPDPGRKDRGAPERYRCDLALRIWAGRSIARSDVLWPTRSASSNRRPAVVLTPKRPTIPRLEPAPLLKRLAAEGKTFASLAQTAKAGLMGARRTVLSGRGPLGRSDRARDALPDLLSQAAADYGARPAIEFRERPSLHRAGSDGRGRGVAAFRAPAYGTNSRWHCSRQFAGSSANFSALKAGARVGISARSTANARCAKLSDAARAFSSPVISRAVADGAEVPEKGLLDRLIVCEDDHWGGSAIRIRRSRKSRDRPSRHSCRAQPPGAVAAYRRDDVALPAISWHTGLPKGAMSATAISPRRVGL